MILSSLFCSGITGRFPWARPTTITIVQAAITNSASNSDRASAGAKNQYSEENSRMSLHSRMRERNHSLSSQLAVLSPEFDGTIHSDSDDETSELDDLSRSNSQSTSRQTPRRNINKNSSTLEDDAFMYADHDPSMDIETENHNHIPAPKITNSVSTTSHTRRKGR